MAKLRSTRSKDGRPRITIRVAFRALPEDLYVAAADLVEDRYHKRASDRFEHDQELLERIADEIGAEAIADRLRRLYWLSGNDVPPEEGDLYENAYALVVPRVRALFPDVDFSDPPAKG